MTSLMTLFVPLLLSAVFVFMASSLIHMVLPWHKGDYPKMANQDQVMAALRPFAIAPGDYFFPRPESRDDLRSPAFNEKMKQGPVVVMTVMPSGSMSMGRNLGFWFVYCVVANLFAAYIASRALAPGAVYIDVFRFVGATAFIGYALALWQLSIWYYRSWMITIKSTVDGLIYALLTAGTFGWLWPR
jgi:hypothetical protein